MPNAEIIGKRIENLLLRKGITKSKCAEDINISRSAMDMYCRGERVPRDSIKKDIANYLGESVESIFFADSSHAT